jgi:NAD(P)-dependent dehydrogenase (short-subunit alcohol dehydrogenase family)
MVAIVTGAGSGLGKAVAEYFAGEGRPMALLDRDAAAVSTVAAELKDSGTRLLHASLDVSDEASVRDAFARSLRELGPASVLINAAGVVDMRPAIEMPTEAWKRVLDVNLTGSFLCAKEAAGQMIAAGEGGRIVNFASVSGLRASVGRIAYGTSKAAVVAMTEQLAVEWAEHGITVNAIAPGPIETPMSASLSTQAKEAYLSRIPARRYGKPTDIVHAVAYLTSGGAGFVTGHTLVVDGGFTVFGLPAF